MEPLIRNFVVGLVPQPTQLPPAPFGREALQRAFFDVTQHHSYQQFAFTPGDTGAEFANSPADGVTIQPQLLQVRCEVDLTAERAREKVVDVVTAVSRRLSIESFLQLGIKVIAHVPAPGEAPSARAFVGDQLMRGTDHADELGPQFFAGGVKFRSIEGDGLHERVLLIEPFVGDDSYIFIDYDVQLRTPATVKGLGDAIDEAVGFVRGPTMRVLEA